MRTTTLSLILILLASTIKGQVTKTEIIKADNIKLIEVETRRGEIQLTSWDKDFIELRTTVFINGGKDNDAFDLQIEKTIGSVKIIETTDEDLFNTVVTGVDAAGNEVKFIPDDLSFKDNHQYKNLNYGYDIQMKIELSVPRNKKVDINTLYGDIGIVGAYQSAKVISTYGIIELELDQVDRMDYMNFKSTYGLVDFSLSPNSNVMFELYTSYGEMYSDLPLKVVEGNKPKNQCTASNSRYKLNNGAQSVSIASDYGSIYLRESKKKTTKL